MGERTNGSATQPADRSNGTGSTSPITQPKGSLAWAVEKQAVGGKLRIQGNGLREVAFWAQAIKNHLSRIPAHKVIVTVAPFRAWRGSPLFIAGGPRWPLDYIGNTQIERRRSISRALPVSHHPFDVDGPGYLQRAFDRPQIQKSHDTFARLKTQLLSDIRIVGHGTCAPHATKALCVCHL